jgi:mRNA interferase RelE/StbE
VASYSVEIKRSAATELDELPTKECARVVAKIQALASEPRPHGCEKLAADEKYRIRQGVYRVLYQIVDAATRVTIVKIAHLREVYR